MNTLSHEAALPKPQDLDEPKTHTSHDTQGSASHAGSLMSHMPFEFTGSGVEYFKIWIVNVLLSIITLGIYSAWGKVRSQKYLSRHTVFANVRFDYHGNPLDILKGRLVVFGVLLLLVAVNKLFPLVYVGMILVFLVLSPWFMVMAMRYHLRNSSWSRIRFNTSITAWGLMKVELLVMVVSFFTRGFGMPWALNIRSRTLSKSGSLGTARFSMQECTGAFYAVYFWVMGVGFLCLLVSSGLIMFPIFYWNEIWAIFFKDHTGFPGIRLVGILLLGHIILFVLLPVFFGLLSLVFYEGIRSAAWSGTSLTYGNSTHQFQSKVRLFQFLKLYAGNIFLIILTFGLYTPFGKIRVLRYRLSCMTLMVQGGLSGIQAVVDSSMQKTSSLGDAAVDGFGIDLAL